MITGVSVNWNEEWANSPEFVIHVKIEGDRFKSTFTDYEHYRAFPMGGDCAMYVALGMVWGSFFYHNPSNECRYAGAVFPIILDSGEQIKVKGPWSSRSACVNELLNPEDHLLDVIAAVSDDVHNSPSNYAAAIRLSVLQEMLPEGIGIRAVSHNESDEFHYEPYDKQDRSKKLARHYKYEYPFD